MQEWGDNLVKAGVGANVAKAGVGANVAKAEVEAIVVVPVWSSALRSKPAWSSRILTAVGVLNLCTPVGVPFCK